MPPARRTSTPLCLKQCHRATQPPFSPQFSRTRTSPMTSALTRNRGRKPYSCEVLRAGSVKAVGGVRGYCNQHSMLL